MTMRQHLRRGTATSTSRSLNRAFMLAAFVRLVAIRVEAAESRIPIYQPGTAITQGGAYYLSSSITGGMPGAIQIQGPASETRTIDLNGMTIDAPWSIAIDIDGAKNVVVKNGTVRGTIRIANATSVELSHLMLDQGDITFTAGLSRSVLLHDVTVSSGFIQLQGVRDGTLRDVKVLAGGMAMPAVSALNCERLVLERVEGHSDSAYPPLMVEGGQHIQVRQCVLQSDVIPGTSYRESIELRNTSFPWIVDSQLGGVRLLMTTSGAKVENNAIRGSTDGGVWIDAAVSHAIVRGNEISGCFTGVTVYGWRNVLQDNVISDSEAQGIVVYGNFNTIRGNTVSSAQWIGIQIGDFGTVATRNQIIGNVVAVSPGGLQLQSGTTENAYRDNTITGSGGIQDQGTNADMGGNLIAY